MEMRAFDLPIFYRSSVVARYRGKMSGPEIDPTITSVGRNRRRRPADVNIGKLLRVIVKT